MIFYYIFFINISLYDSAIPDSGCIMSENIRRINIADSIHKNLHILKYRYLINI